EPSRSFILIIIVGTITTFIREVLSYRLPELCNNLDIFVPLIAINSFVLYHFTCDSSQKTGLKFLFIYVKKWLVVVCLIFIVSVLREILGKGTLFNRPMLVPDLETKFLLLVNTPFGALIITAVVLMVFYLLKRRTNG
ncbi:MAG: Rnf-Nqr domain containing protein, partial [candidate division WOR-3 bacterium]